MKSQVLFNENESRELDRITIQERGISGTLLMGFAALSVFKAWEVQFRSAQKIIILCGSGNNGGDGYALAQFLKAEGLQVEIFSKSGAFSEETKYYKNLTESLKIPILPLEKFQASIVHPGLMLVDCLLGTGFKEPLEGEISRVAGEISKAKEKFKSSIFILSIDAVSGFIPEKEFPFDADALAEIGSPKLKNLFYPLSKEKKSFHPIGFLREEFSTKSRVFIRANEEELKSRLRREKDSHKYKNGSAVFVGGSEGMAGAILSSALTFQELGGGISQILTPSESTLTKVLKKDPSFMISKLESGKDGYSSSFVKKARVIAVGPGLTKSDLPSSAYPKDAKIVLDAGALQDVSNRKLSPNFILTPHLGEWNSLTGKSSPNIYASLEEAQDWAKEKNCYLLLKGSVSVLFSPDGISYFWEYQEPRLAVMGTGDLLVGVLSFFLSRGEEIVESVRLAESLLLYCAEQCKGFPTAGRIRKKIRNLVETELL
ncbi:NAD(P)H-hydrate epimerase [Leptospira langatensis]|uniref:Bifunctional NAD(P)H-hydrate repair enzyme n=1 Tax=Leptospira langatensis TaxID=2484983 RepID=A0A5F1ZP19_9LEPT|nr:NAD(P)H-hydrate epimerase [Leptospira langatensis]TGK05265.1 NAD(P)H-hydrate epimerase [Leptospira langatensis]TGL38401.1 NAD(P)H-hydrate epimerase [Leptospira langatensis]